MMEHWKEDRVGAAIRGENPTVMLKMKSGYAVIADNQYLPGYCALLACPKADSLNELSMENRAQYLLDMSLIGDAIIKTCNPLRLNYCTLMNKDHYLHTHIEARYDWEMDEYKQRPGFDYPREIRHTAEFEYTELKYGTLKSNITKNLEQILDEIGYWK